MVLKEPRRDNRVCSGQLRSIRERGWRSSSFSRGRSIALLHLTLSTGSLDDLFLQRSLTARLRAAPESRDLLLSPSPHHRRPSLTARCRPHLFQPPRDRSFRALPHLPRLKRPVAFRPTRPKRSVHPSSPSTRATSSSSETRSSRTGPSRSRCSGPSSRRSCRCVWPRGGGGRRGDALSHDAFLQDPALHSVTYSPKFGPGGALKS